MKPNTLSASSVHVAELCLARWRAENYMRGARTPNDAATLGTTVHAALEQYVVAVYIDKVEQKSFDLLKLFYLAAFIENFGTGDSSDPRYRDGLDMLQTWFDRSDDLDRVTVLTVETKQSFDLPTSVGPIPFNYIFDRFDRIGEDEYRVVDYKSSAWDVKSDDLPKKIQPRVYAVAAAIMYPDAKKIWVEFDMLRHNRVGRVFTRDDNIATWKMLKAAAERIIRADENDPPETLNNECRFCIRKTTCEAVRSNALVGGIMSLEFDEMVDRMAELNAQAAALRAAQQELEKQLTAVMKERDEFEAEGKKGRAFFKISRRRSVDADRVKHMVPEAIWNKYGSSSITIKDFEYLMKDPALSPEVRASLKGMIFMGSGEPKLNAEFKKGEEDDH